MFGIILGAKYFEAILNVLGIIVLAVAAGFIILLLIDLILGCIDGKRGVIFFRNRKNTDRDNEILVNLNKENLNNGYYLQNNKELTLGYEKQEEPKKEENNIDFAKAEEERKEIEQKVEEMPQTDNEESLEEVNDDFTYINKVSPEIEKEIQKEQEENKNEEENEEDLDDFDLDDEDDDDKSIEEILEAIKGRNQEARNKFLVDEDVEPDFNEDEELKSPEEEIQQATEEKEEIEEVKEEIEKQDNVSNEEVEKLNALIKELNDKIEAEQKKNQELEEKSKLEIENLKKELETKPVAQEIVTEETVKVLEDELAKLLERQKQNDKDLKLNKKEYIPLARIERTLESDRNKLRRKEAIVAKKKMIIFGVNNYNEDEEKEKKLAEDLDLLQGLKMSVEHCEKVMEENKDRYPVLKRTNEILSRNAQDLENDINDVQNKLAYAKEVLGANSGDDNSQDSGNDEN